MASKNLFRETIEKYRKEILNGKLSYGTLLPPEKQLAEEMNVSRPTIAKVYNALQSEGLVKKRPGSGTQIVFNKDKKRFTFGLLLPGSGETEIFGIVNDQFLVLEKENDFTFLWDGTIANNAEMRQSIAVKIGQSYIERKVDGVFFSPLERTHQAHNLNETLCKMFDANNIPVILMDRDIAAFPNRSRYDIVGIDNFQAAYIMTQHMIKEGCEKIYFFHRKDSASTVDSRVAGCRMACLDSGIAFKNDNLIVGEPSDNELVSKIKIISKKTGILCANDSTAAVLMSTLNKQGKVVQVDLLMAGFDDMKYAKHLQVPLTSYRQPLMDIVRNSYLIMLRRISNPYWGAVNVNLTGKLVIEGINPLSIMNTKTKPGNMKKICPGLAVLTAGLLILAFMESCKPAEKVSDVKNTYYAEPYRPQFHFSPEAHWMNDPNGMVFLDGEYHLFYQYFPDSNVWGPMHWGHAVSTDLVHWNHLPVALAPDSLGYIFSGSAVADTKNTSGLGTSEKPPLVAIFTYHDPVGEKKGSLKFQNEGIAFSTDKGRTWTKYAGNPVLKNPGIRDFRDPKVFWHEESHKWIMILAVHDRIHLYSSPNLLEWTFLSEFGHGIGGHGGVWECPDLFRIRVNGTGEMKWVMLVSINPGGPNGGSATQYFIGNFDGTHFITDYKDIFWVDWGRDNYAGVTWSNIPESDGRRLFLGWMSNWQYATVVPTEIWRSAMTVPRELKLVHNKSGYVLTSNPVEELKTLRDKKPRVYREIRGKAGEREITPDSIRLSQSELLFNFSILNDSVDSLGIILENNAHQKIILGYSRTQRQLFVDRTSSGLAAFSKLFAGISKAPYIAESELALHVFVDASSVELFVDNGNRVLTNLVFPKEEFTHLNVFSTGGEIILKSAEFYNMKRIW